MKLLVLSFVLLLSSCSTQRFNMSNGVPRTTPNHEGKHHFIFWGIGQEKQVNPGEVCQNDQSIEAVDTHLTFVDGLLGGLTWGIYSPRSYRVYCSTKK